MDKKSNHAAYASERNNCYNIKEVTFLQQKKLLLSIIFIHILMSMMFSRTVFGKLF